MAAARAGPLVIVLTSIALAAGVAYAANAAVAMKDVQFQPASVTIDVGDSVTWTNQDGQVGVSHSATADDGSFDTGIFLTGSRSVTFTRAATITYHCAVHPTFMRGTVRVLGPATPMPTPAPTPRPTPPPTIAPPTTPPRTAAPPAATSAPPSPTPTPTATATPSPTATPTATPSPTSVAVQATVSPAPTPTVAATTTSRSDEGPGPGLIGAAVLGIAVLAGLGVYLARRA